MMNSLAALVDSLWRDICVKTKIEWWVVGSSQMPLLSSHALLRGLEADGKSNQRDFSLNCYLVNNFFLSLAMISCIVLYYPVLTFHVLSSPILPCLTLYKCKYSHLSVVLITRVATHNMTTKGLHTHLEYMKTYHQE